MYAQANQMPAKLKLLYKHMTLSFKWSSWASKPHCYHIT